MKVLMLLSNPFVSDARVYNEASSLVSGGHDVTILCWDKEGDQKIPKREVVNEIKVMRIGLDGFHRNLRDWAKSRPSSALNDKVLGLQDLLLYKWFWNRTVSVASKMKIDVVHCHDLDTLPAGVKLKRSKGTRLIYDSHEVFPWNGPIK